MDISVDGVGLRHAMDPAVAPEAYGDHTINAGHPLYRFASVNPAGEAVRLVIELPDRKRVTALGRIVHARAHDGDDVCGVQFTALSSGDRALIAALGKGTGGGSSA